MGKGNGLSADMDIDRLAKLYVEPTNRCNLDCRTCMRQGWDEGLGFMEFGFFEKIVKDLHSLPERPSIFFGGFGEPLSHPRIADMVGAAKLNGSETELISNGILLDDEMTDRLVAAGLDRLWVSIDGASPQSYADVRLGDYLPLIIANLERLNARRRKPELGISFVAMKRNIADLPAVLDLAQRLGASRFSFSNIEPYTGDMEKEVLYGQVLFEPLSEGGVRVPRFDPQVIAEKTLERMNALFPGTLSSLSLSPERKGLCPFLQRRSASVRWDGGAGPCLPLLHGHTVFLNGHSRTWPEFHFGSLSGCGLAEFWNSEAWRDFRRKQDEFAFAPCTTCNSCDLPDINNEDCFGNVHPACGGCLWSQGFIQCP
ncbi:MAG: radical SAM protein [Candidatus Aminicenantes bacterium]|nr:radical SAM protein [Candidatus Aminicenantes bacterium]